MSEEKPRGFTCPACGTEHKFTGYVYAHWDLSLTFTCPATRGGGLVCGASIKLLQGRVVSVVQVTTGSHGNRRNRSES